ncbi:phage/plasmid primase, P4 family [Desulfonatronum parangueonense]
MSTIEIPDIFEQQARYAAIPGETKTFRQWVAAKVAPNPAKPHAKPRKPPINVHSGQGASTGNPATWATFDETREFLDEWNGTDHTHVDQEMGELTGPLVCPGFNVTSNDPYCFIDLDGCFDASGTLEPWARAIVENMAAYTEVSLSGRGLHILIRGRKPGTSCKRKINDHGGEIEIYDQGRYVAITGNIFEGRDTIHDRQAELDSLYQQFFSTNGAGSVHSGEDEARATDSTVTAEIVMARAMRSKQGPKLQALLQGNDAGHNDDTSAADQAACNILAFHCGHIPDNQAEAIIDEIVRNSGRYRHKWDQPRGEGTYGSLTIREALAKVTDRWTGTGERKPTRATGAAELMAMHRITLEDAIKAALTGQKGAAEMFITLNRGVFCFDHASGNWYQFKDHFWEAEVIGTPIKALDDVQAILKRAEADLDGQIVLNGNEQRQNDDPTTKENLKTQLASLEKQRKAVAQAVHSLNHLHFREQVCKFSAVGPGSLGITGDEWDGHPWLLATPAGIIDLKTGAIRPGQPDDMIKSPCPTAYDPGATCPTFENFISTVFEDDPELVRFVQRVFGAALIGQSTYKQFLIILHGQGRNGKDTLLSIIAHVLGNHLAGTIAAELLLDSGKFGRRSSQGPSADIMRLRGLRLAFATETSDGRRFDSGMAKMLSGGGSLTARPPYGRRNIEFEQSQLIFLLTNHRPHAPVDDYAFWKRVKNIPFVLSFVDDPQQPHERLKIADIADQCKAEAPGILNWMIQGCLDYQRNGLPEPEAVKAATEQYIKDEDLIGHFIEDCCFTGQQFSVKAGALYHRYKEWAVEGNTRPMTATAFGRYMGKRFHKDERKIYYGLALQSDREETF